MTPQQTVSTGLTAKRGDPCRTVRFPQHVWDALKASTPTAGRSENSQIVFLVAKGLGLVEETATKVPQPSPQG